MKKLVIKTSLITLASVVCALIIAFGSVALFAPGVVGGLFDGVGNYSATVFFYEKQYQKTGDIDDLNRLVSKINIVKDSGRAETYYSKIITHKDFVAFCGNIDGAGREPSAKDYYYSCYSLSLAENGKIDKAIDFAKDYVQENGYTENNPFRTIVYDYAHKATDVELNKLKEQINALNQSGEFILQDISYLNSNSFN